MDADDVTTSTPRITDLPHLCLENIISDLDVINMLNLAATNQLFLSLVGSAFHRKFGTKTFWLNLNGFPNNEIRENQRRIMINGMKYCMPLLRLFGTQISTLVVADERNIHVDRYISRYCSDTLTSITFNYRSEFSADHFMQPFNCVETLRIIECDLGPHLLCLAQWFPNVRRLRIYKSIRNYRFDRVHFPHLESLHISFASMGLLRVNPQIRSLALNIESGGRPTKFLDFVISNRSLLKLTVSNGHHLIVMTTCGVNRLIKEHRILVELNLPQYRFTADDAIAVIRGLNSLRKFRFQPKDFTEYGHLLERLDAEWICQPHEHNPKILILQR